MEVFRREPNETNIRLFKRIEKAQKISQYFVYWPLGAKRVGVDVELGALLDRLSSGRDHDVRLFVQEGAGRLHPDGEFECMEEGRRTGYYQDLVAHGCPIVLWEDHSDLFDSFLQHADP
jgi:hypothetical protein